MKKKDMKRPVPGRHGGYNQLVREYQARIQADLMPEHAEEFAAINVETGEYALGKTADEAYDAFLERWPDTMMHLCRVDGGAVVKFHGI